MAPSPSPAVSSLSPSSDHVSMVGCRSKSVLSSDDAWLALPMSGANEKTDPADCAPKMTDENTTKKWNMSYSPLASRLPPYQKPSASTRMLSDCDDAYRTDDLRTDTSEDRCCSSRLSRYCRRTSSSRVCQGLETTMVSQCLSPFFLFFSPVILSKNCTSSAWILICKKGSTNRKGKVKMEERERGKGYI